MNTIKSTVNINADLKSQLDNLIDSHYAESFTSAVNHAIAMYIKAAKREMYKKQMEEAQHDEDYIARTMSSQEAFSTVDAEGDDEW